MEDEVALQESQKALVEPANLVITPEDLKTLLT